MSSDTRMLPRKGPQTTGIPRTTTAPARPVIGGQGGSGVSASPAADRSVQDHVKKANQGRGPAPIMPPGYAAAASAPASAPLTMRPPISSAHMAGVAAAVAGVSERLQRPSSTFDEQQTAFLVFLIDHFLGDEQSTDDARALAMRTLATLAQMAGGALAQQRIEIAQRGAAPPPIDVETPADAPSQEG